MMDWMKLEMTRCRGKTRGGSKTSWLRGRSELEQKYRPPRSVILSPRLSIHMLTEFLRQSRLLLHSPLNRCITCLLVTIASDR